MKAITANPARIRGKLYHRVIIPADKEWKKREQRYFATKEEAKVFAAQVNDERLGRIPELFRLSLAEQGMLAAALNKAGSAQGVLEAVNAQGEPIKPATIREAIDALIADRRDANKSKEYVSALHWTLNHFARARNHVPINKVTVEHVRDWLKQIGGTPDMRRAYITRIRGLFTFAAHQSRKWCKENPAKGVSLPERGDSEIEIFTPDECRRLLGAAAKDRGMVAYFALCLFAGLRPSEARRLQPENVKADLIHVTMKVARKKKEVRNIPMNDALRAWLAISEPLPVPPGWKKRFQAIVKASGVKWKQDGMRHSFVTYFNELHGWQDTVKIAGHSLAMMIEHYKALVTRQAAEEFWAIRPE